MSPAAMAATKALNSMAVDCFHSWAPASPAADNATYVRGLELDVRLVNAVLRQDNRGVLKPEWRGSLRGIAGKVGGATKPVVAFDDDQFLLRGDGSIADAVVDCWIGPTCWPVLRVNPTFGPAATVTLARVNQSHVFAVDVNRGLELSVDPDMFAVGQFATTLASVIHDESMSPSASPLSVSTRASETSVSALQYVSAMVTNSRVSLPGTKVAFTPSRVAELISTASASSSTFEVHAVDLIYDGAHESARRLAMGNVSVRSIAKDGQVCDVIRPSPTSTTWGELIWTPNFDHFAFKSTAHGPIFLNSTSYDALAGMFAAYAQGAVVVAPLPSAAQELLSRPARENMALVKEKLVSATINLDAGCTVTCRLDDSTSLQARAETFSGRVNRSQGQSAVDATFSGAQVYVTEESNNRDAVAPLFDATREPCTLKYTSANGGKSVASVADVHVVLHADYMQRCRIFFVPPIERARAAIALAERVAADALNRDDSDALEGVSQLHANQPKVEVLIVAQRRVSLNGFTFLPVGAPVTLIPRSRVLRFSQAGLCAATLDLADREITVPHADCSSAEPVIVVDAGITAFLEGGSLTLRYDSQVRADRANDKLQEDRAAGNPTLLSDLMSNSLLAIGELSYCAVSSSVKVKFVVEIADDAATKPPDAEVMAWRIDAPRLHVTMHGPQDTMTRCVANVSLRTARVLGALNVPDMDASLCALSIATSRDGVHRTVVAPVDVEANFASDATRSCVTFHTGGSSNGALSVVVSPGDVTFGRQVLLQVGPLVRPLPPSVYANHQLAEFLEAAATAKAGGHRLTSQSTRVRQSDATIVWDFPQATLVIRESDSPQSSTLGVDLSSIAGSCHSRAVSDWTVTGSAIVGARLVADGEDCNLLSPSATSVQASFRGGSRNRSSFSASASNCKVSIAPSSARSLSAVLTSLRDSVSRPVDDVTTVAPQSTGMLRVTNMLDFDVRLPHAETVIAAGDGVDVRFPNDQLHIDCGSEGLAVLPVTATNPSGFSTADLEQGRRLVVEWIMSERAPRLVLHPPLVIRSRLATPVNISMGTKTCVVLPFGAAGFVQDAPQLNVLDVEHGDFGVIPLAECKSSTLRCIFTSAHSSDQQESRVIIVSFEQAEGCLYRVIVLREGVSIANNTGGRLRGCTCPLSLHQRTHSRTASRASETPPPVAEQYFDLADGEFAPLRVSPRSRGIVFSALQHAQSFAPDCTCQLKGETPRIAFSLDNDEAEEQHSQVKLVDATDQSHYVVATTQRVSECGGQVVIAFSNSHWVVNRTEYPVLIARDETLGGRKHFAMMRPAHGLHGALPCTGDPFTVGLKSGLRRLTSGDYRDEYRVNVSIKIGDQSQWSDSTSLLVEGQPQPRLVVCRGAPNAPNVAAWLQVHNPVSRHQLEALGLNRVHGRIRSPECWATMIPPAVVTLSPARLLVNNTPIALLLRFGGSDNQQPAEELEPFAARPCSDLTSTSEWSKAAGLSNITCVVLKGSSSPPIVVSMAEGGTSRLAMVDQTSGRSLQYSRHSDAGGMIRYVFDLVASPAMWVENRLSYTVQLVRLEGGPPVELSPGDRVAYNFPLLADKNAAGHGVPFEAIAFTRGASSPEHRIDCSRPVQDHDAVSLAQFANQIPPSVRVHYSRRLSTIVLILASNASQTLDRVAPQPTALELEVSIANCALRIGNADCRATLLASTELRTDGGSSCLVLAEARDVSITPTESSGMRSNQSISIPSMKTRWAHDTFGAISSNIKVRRWAIDTSNVAVDVDDLFVACCLRDGEKLARAVTGEAFGTVLLSASRYHRDQIAETRSQSTGHRRIVAFENVSLAPFSISLTLVRLQRSCFKPWIGGYGSLLPSLTKARLAFTILVVDECDDATDRLKTHLTDQVTGQWFKLTSIGNTMGNLLR
jgi:hypothetical protein